MTVYKVVVSYREPDYEQRTGPRATPYRWTYAVRADSEEEARRRALSEFREVSRMSSVGWWREVVAVEVCEAPARERADAVDDRARDAESPGGARRSGGARQDRG
jgi:hypothetical protein